jgi:predicted nuclease of predicted toxin-antitoxin system
VIVWLDNHLSPLLATWIAETFAVECVQVRDLGMARASDPAIFDAAAAQAAVLITKDSDFAELVGRKGPPPSIILLTCGNTSTAALRVLLADRLLTAFALIAEGEPLVEIGAME